MLGKYIKNHLLLITTIVMGLLFFSFTLPFLSWILLAATIAMALKPLQNDFFVKRLNFSKALSFYGLLSIILIFLIPFIISFVSLFTNVKDQLSNIETSKSITSVETILKKAYGNFGALSKIVPEEEALEYTRKGAEKVVGQLISTVSQGVKHLPHFLLSLFMFCASLFYFIVDARDIKRFICRLNFIEEDSLNRLIEIVKTSCQSTVFAALLTGATQATIVALPAKFLGFHYFMSTFFITFFLSQIPLIGTAPAWIFIMGYFYVNEDISAVVIMAVVGGLAGISDNIVRVWFLNQYESLHPLAGFFAALGGLVVIGPVGVILGPVVTMIFYKLLKEELLKPAPAKEA